MSFLEELITEINKAKQPKKESKVNKFLEFEKQLRDLAKSKGLQPRTFLEQLAKSNPELAKNKIIIKLIGEQDVPQQKGRDAKPEVLTKRAMNVVKKTIKKSANKQRRRMDKDSVSEDEKDDFSQLINPMGQDSTSLKKIKQSPGFHDLIVTMFASGTQADLEQDEILHYISKMLNINTVEIKAILQKDGFDFAEPDAETKFKQNMGATGGFQIGKGKSRTLNSMYEGSLDQFRNLYKKSIGSDDAAVTLRELIKVINDDALWSDQFPQLKQFTGVSPLSGSKVVTAKKIPGDSADEKIAALVTAIDDDEWVNDTAKHLMRSFTLGEDEAQDRGYAQMIIQQHQDEYKKFMDTGDLFDAPTIYEKLFAYFSSSDASEQMPYGTQKARDGDPYVWLTDKLDDLGLTESIHENADQGALKAWYDKYNKYKSADVDNLADGMFKFYRDSGVELDAIEKREYAVLVKKYGEDRITGDAFDYLDDDGITSAMFKEFAQIMGEPASEKSVEKALSMLGLDEGNEFAQKVRQMKAAGAKKGTKFKTSDGEEHTLEQASKKTIDSFHTELDRLVHKYFGHSSDEKREKQKMKEDDQGEVRVGSYQTKHFDICPSATKLYQDIDVEDMDLAERSAKLHDTLFYMEKHAKEMKQADPEYIEMMQNLADQIMAMAGMMGLESEHEYVQSHVDAVKNMKESVTESVAITEQEFDEAAGEKDACYHKVKSRYKVWPSAYASGALVKCRKVGASNWGNKSK